MSAIRNITIGRTERLYKPVSYTMLANLVNIVPFCLSIEAIRIIFRAFNGGGQSLDTTRLWCIFGCMTGYIAVMVLAERAAYRANFRGAYEMSASGRISLAEHLRKLSLGFLGKRDPGDLSSMLITDFTMAETGISHYLPQLMGASVSYTHLDVYKRQAQGDTRQTLWGFLGGLLFWTGWVEFLFMYFANRFGTQPELDPVTGEIVTRPEYLILPASFGFWMMVMVMYLFLSLIHI